MESPKQLPERCDRDVPWTKPSRNHRTTQIYSQKILLICENIKSSTATASPQLIRHPQTHTTTAPISKINPSKRSNTCDTSLRRQTPSAQTSPFGRPDRLNFGPMSRLKNQLLKTSATYNPRSSCIRFKPGTPGIASTRKTPQPLLSERTLVLNPPASHVKLPKKLCETKFFVNSTAAPHWPSSNNTFHRIHSLFCDRQTASPHDPRDN